MSELLLLLQARAQYGRNELAPDEGVRQAAAAGTGQPGRHWQSNSSSSSRVSAAGTRTYATY